MKFGVDRLAWAAAIAVAGSGLVAQESWPFDRHKLNGLRSEHESVRKQAEPHVRAAARWALAHADAAKLLLPATSEMRFARDRPGQLYGTPRPRIDNVFALAVLLQDPDPEVRATAAAVLREELGRAPRAATLIAAGAAPSSTIWEQWQRTDVPPEVLPRIVEQARAGRVDPALLGRFAGLDDQTRSRLAVQLVQAVMTLGEDTEKPGPGGPGPGGAMTWGLPPQTPRYVPRGTLDRVAVACLGAAIELHEIGRTTLLAHAVQVDTDPGRRRVMAALRVECERLRDRRDGFAAGATPLALSLLDAESPVDRQTAALVLWHVPPAPPELREGVFERARERVAHLAESHAPDFPQQLPRGDAPSYAPWHPETMDQLLVGLAMRWGDTTLIEPLCEGLADVRDPAQPLAWRPAQPPAWRRAYAELLALAAPHANEAQVRRMFEVATANGDDALGLGGVRGLFDALFEFVPEDLRPQYLEAAHGAITPEQWRRLECGSGPLPPHLVELLLATGNTGRPWNTMLERAPELLLKALDQGDAAVIRRLGEACSPAVIERLLPELLRRDPERLASVLLVSGTRRPLPLLVHCRDVRDVQNVMPELIGTAPPHPDELRLLGELCAAQRPATAVAAALRARRFGDEGRALWSALPACVAEASPAGASLALRAMLAAGEPMPGWRELAERCDGLLEATAARIRFGDEAVDIAAGLSDPLTRPRTVELLQLAGVPIDVATLRRTAADSDLLYQLKSLDGPRLAALEYAAELTPWSEGLERRILDLTDDADAVVRRAAYLALKSRDPELWPCAWLVGEAEFDPDAAVRAVAR